jgi:hypothetical protein
MLFWTFSSFYVEETCFCFFCFFCLCLCQLRYILRPHKDMILLIHSLIIHGLQRPNILAFNAIIYWVNCGILDVNSSNSVKCSQDVNIIFKNHKILEEIIKKKKWFLALNLRLLACKTNAHFYSIIYWVTIYSNSYIDSSTFSILIKRLTECKSYL